MSKRNQFFSSSNPFVSEERYRKSAQGDSFGIERNDTMTVQGAVNKTLILSGILFLTAFVGIYIVMNNPNAAMPLMWTGIIGGLVCCLIAMFKPNTASITAPLYAAFEGLALGVISLVYAMVYDAGSWGIVFNAIMLTMLCLVVMLGAYKSGLIKPTEKFRSVIMTATGAIMMIYLVNFGMNMIFGGGIPYLHEGGLIGIGISLVIIVIAALNLILDFDNFEKGEQMGASKNMEWVSALGLLVTLVWLYLEILRLLAMFSGRD